MGKWEVLNIVYGGIYYEIRTILEHWNFGARNFDEAWDLLEWLTQDIYEFETSFVNSSTLSPYTLDYALPVCKICNCSSHNNNVCPCYIFANGFARLTNMIEIMNEQQTKFANYLCRYDLLH